MEPRLTRRQANKRNVLCLGVSYADIDKHIDARHGPDCMGIDSFRKPSVDAAVLCVRKGLLTQMDGRDLARCRSTEESSDMAVEVYTVSQEQGAVYREDRHLSANFNRHDFVRSLQKRFGEGKSFHQIILDYFWIPQGWDANHWGKSFFERNLVSFATENILPKGGAIYLPFCLHCFKQLQICFSELRKYYNISFLRKSDLHEISLWKGTQNINSVIMQQILGKHKSQEDTYCTFGPKDISEAMEDPAISKEQLIRLARSLEDFADIRFMKLELLQESDSKGVFRGIKDPSQVKRGFDQLSLSLVSPGEVVAPRAVTPHNRSPPKQKRTPSAKRKLVFEPPQKKTISVRTKRQKVREAREPGVVPSSLPIPPTAVRFHACLPATVTPTPKRNHRYRLRSSSPTSVATDTRDAEHGNSGARKSLF